MDTPSELSQRKSVIGRSKKSLRRSTFSRRIQSKEHLMELLSKNRRERTRTENKIISEYLAAHIAFFADLNNPTDFIKLEKLTEVINYEFYCKGQTIIHYGEEGDKFYVLIEGLILITKPAYPQKTMRLNEYMNYMRNILLKEKDQAKYDRVIEKNHYMRFDMELLFKAKSDSYLMRQEFTLFIEEDEIMGEYAEPFSFGDIALIKKAKRNATVKALKDCKMVTIDKTDYNKIIRELEERRLEKQLIDFKKKYPLFIHWSSNNLIKLFNCFSNHALAQGDYLYKQNEESDAIYIVKSGIFEMFSMLSFGWVNEFFEYIVISKGNLVYFFKNLKTQLKEKDLYEYIDKKREETGESPCQFNPQRSAKVTISNQEEDSLEKIRNDQEEILNPYNLFKVLVKRVNQYEVLGIEDALELKKRYCFVKCISSTASVEKINVSNLFGLLAGVEEPSLDLLLDVIAQKKAFLFKQLLNATKQRAKILGTTFAFRCGQVLGKEKPTEEAKLVSFNFRDNVFFDQTLLFNDIKDKVYPFSLNMSTRRKLKCSLTKTPSKRIFSPFLNYNNCQVQLQSGDGHQKHHSTFESFSSKKMAFSIGSTLSNQSSSSNVATMSQKIQSKKRMMFSRNSNSVKKIGSTGLLKTNPSVLKIVKGADASSSLRSEYNAVSKALSLEHSKRNLFKNTKRLMKASKSRQLITIRKMSSLL